MRKMLFGVLMLALQADGVSISPSLPLDYEYKGRIEKGAFWMDQGVEVPVGYLAAQELRFVVEDVEGAK